MPTSKISHLRLFRLKQVAELFSMTPENIRSLVRAGQFPAPVRVGSRLLAWRQSDLEAYLDERTVKPGPDLAGMAWQDRRRYEVFRAELEEQLRPQKPGRETVHAQSANHSRPG